MAREIILDGSDYTGDNPLYFAAYLVSDDRYINGTSLETYNASHWTSYAVALTQDATTGEYLGDFPQVQAGTYYVTIYEQLGASPAVDDTQLAQGEYEYPGTVTVPAASSDFNDQMQLDALAMFGEFAEDGVYTPDGASPVTLKVIVDRRPYEAAKDGRTVTADMTVCVLNHATLGRTAITPMRDTITLPGRFGGVAKAHTVQFIVSGDQGVWTLGVK